MTDQEYKQLAKLVTYLLESEDWKCIWINEYAEPIRLFMFKTGLTYRKVHKYITEALQKLLGPVFNVTQRRLANKCCSEDDLLLKPKPKYVSAPTGKKHSHNAGKTLVPWSEFGRKYVEHYGYGSAENKSQYMRERKFYKDTGICSWEVEKQKSRSGISATCFLYVRLII